MIHYEDKILSIPSKYNISYISSILKNFKIEIINIDKKNQHFLYYLDKALNEESLKIIKLILAKKIPSECRLYFLAEFLTLKEINLIRAIAKYQKQLLFEFEERLIINTLLLYSDITLLIIKYFKNNFSKNDKTIEKKIETELKNITNPNHSKILEFFYIIVKNITKTNFFLNKKTISFKIETKNFKHMLFGIQPNIEMFVYHKDFNGVHLRVSKISRGGIRYSTRTDFREEIKDLMKTQMIKNAFIVPDGAKGGFFLNGKITLKEAYSLYIDSLLDLIDLSLNHDKKSDFYFVVAADRGTSHFSDIANEIAIQRNYFLKDAFASGGSSGYSHKKLGITAKGAIKSAEIYFKESEKNIYKDKISIVGIGSMRGDVFGNAMLLNKNFMLIAAISHNEIFIDPNPEPLTAYKERKRLFENELGWEHYDLKKISKGGGVFKRNDKNIKLTEEIKKLINTKKDTISGEELIKKLLVLKVDMLYFGGIGTYVKASNEFNIHISDKQNENIRINAGDIKAFCVVEGANLALTMKARYEYASNGGKINLDAIDNSAGVNISDYEVNMKITLNELINKKIINEKEKKNILTSLTDEVVKKVLSNNKQHSLIITLDSKSIYKEKLIKVLEVLENKSDFKREYYSIVKNSEIDILYYKNELIRPVCALLMLYTKLFLKKYILNSFNLNDYNEYLKKYFPENFKGYENHPLKNEIIATQITNELINHFGIGFISDFNEETFKFKIISHLFLMKIFNIENLFKEAENLPVKKQYDILIEIQRVLKFSNRIFFKILKKEKIDLKKLIEFNKFDINLEFFEKNKTLAHFIPYILYLSYKKYDLDFTLNNLIKILKTFKISSLLNEIYKIKPKNEIEKKLKDEIEELLEIFVLKLLKIILNNKNYTENILKEYETHLKNTINKRRKKDIMEFTHIVNSMILALN